MTVKEMLDIKYREWLKNIRRREWENVNIYAEAKKMHVAEYMYMCLEITEQDIKNNGGYNGELYSDLKQMHEKKLLASNQHRQEHGHVDKWWLTKKGMKSLNLV